MPRPKPTIGQLIRQARQMRNIRHYHIKVILGIPPRLLASWERDEQTPNKIVLGALVLLLHDCADGPDLAPLKALVWEDFDEAFAAICAERAKRTLPSAEA